MRIPVIALLVLAAGCSASPGDGDAGGDGDGDGGNGADAPVFDSLPPAPGCNPPPEPQGNVHYVATDGDDDAGDGSLGSPWATIGGALDRVADGDTILVRPGTYDGAQELRGTFATGVVVRSEVPYQARLRHTGTVVRCFYGQGISLEGFDIAHAGPGSTALVIQIQDLIGEPGGSDTVSRITIRNNVLHDSHDNDILKINNGASNVLVEGNLFYNQAGSDEHIDVNSVTDVVVQDNVFMNDFAGSGRTNANDTSSYVVIKDSNGTSDTNLGSERITVRRNVYLHWEGSTGSYFVLVGEDGTANYEARDVMVENNLMIGDSGNTMRAAFGVKGSQAITFRHNTVVGDLPSLAFAMRLNVEGSNQDVDDVRFYNNLWSDPTGTMEDFSDTPPAEIASFTLDTNLYWNDGGAIPVDGAELVNYTDDLAPVLGDPQLAAQAGLVLPRWDQGSGQFADGSADICSAHARLVELYGTPGGGSAALGMAAPAQAPDHDILRNPRGSSPDLGAVEVQ